LANCVGVVDSGYRGEITFRYKFAKDSFFAGVKRYNDGDRIGQLVIIPYPSIELEEADELNETVRGEGGYGSTGK
jgi:dUTP pyrophosphatase